MYILNPHASHFLSGLGAAEERTEAYKWYAEGIQKADNNALEKESQQNLGLCSSAGWLGEEYGG